MRLRQKPDKLLNCLSCCFFFLQNAKKMDTTMRTRNNANSHDDNDDDGRAGNVGWMPKRQHLLAGAPLYIPIVRYTNIIVPVLFMCKWAKRMGNDHDDDGNGSCMDAFKIIEFVLTIYRDMRKSPRT